MDQRPHCRPPVEEPADAVHTNERKSDPLEDRDNTNDGEKSGSFGGGSCEEKGHPREQPQDTQEDKTSGSLRFPESLKKPGREDDA